jgi:hypothetical protein
MDQLENLKIKQLKNIVSTHNASEKANVIKNYSKMSKTELIKAIKTQVKQEHLAKILEALKIVQVEETAPVAASMKIKLKKDRPSPPVGASMKIMVKKNRPSDQQGTLDTKLVKEMLMIMEDAGSKTAEKIRKSAMIDEMTAKQENAIVEDFIKMMESQGGMMTEKVKKNIGVKPRSKEQDFQDEKSASYSIEDKGSGRFVVSTTDQLLSPIMKNLFIKIMTADENNYKTPLIKKRFENKIKKANAEEFAKIIRFEFNPNRSKRINFFAKEKFLKDFGVVLTGKTNESGKLI